MLVEESFKKFQIKLDDNFETAKIAVERGRYVILFNESQNRFFETIIKGGNDTTRYAQKLLVKDYKILNTQKKDYDFVIIKHCTNLISHSTIYLQAKKEGGVVEPWAFSDCSY